MAIKNIIFDLGGVILNIDYKKTIVQLNQLSNGRVDKIYSQEKQSEILDLYETGKITSSQFREIIRSDLDLELNDEMFDAIWNAMLLDLPHERLSLIKDLRQSYKTFLFSNTNEIHLQEVFRISERDCNIRNFSDYFDAEYYSHIFGMRKPHKESFLKFLKENNIKAHETLFIDDTLQHVLGAKEAGIHAIHLTQNMSILNTMDFIQEINAQQNQDELPTNSLTFV